jgi:HEAT repeats
MCLAAWLVLHVVPAFSQGHSEGRQVKPPVRAQAPDSPKAQQTESGQNEPVPAEAEQEVLPGDWGPELLYNVLSSPNEDARDALYCAVFAAGFSVVPQLEAALKDDRTAEFAAQARAYIGGPKAFEILTRLVSDPRDLNLRRFYYGALGEFQVPDATNILLSAAAERADVEPDRTVTEAAILALTVQSDPSLASKLRSAGTKVQDPVIRDDLDNATAVIQERARYLASAAGRNASGSLEQTVRVYFMPALETAGTEPATSPVGSSSASARKQPAAAPARQSYATALPHPLPNDGGRPAAAAPKPSVQVEIRHLTFSPEKTRALARVAFEDSSAVAYYDMVLQKRAGNWVLASVWLGSEAEKPGHHEVTRRNPTQSKK